MAKISVSEQSSVGFVDTFVWVSCNGSGLFSLWNIYRTDKWGKGAEWDDFFLALFQAYHPKIIEIFWTGGDLKDYLVPTSLQ